MKKIFISYRRTDSAFAAGWLCEKLTTRFGSNSVFIDVHRIPLAVDFREHIHKALDGCDVVLAMIGDRWTATDDTGQPRICDNNDWVRIELETAIKDDIPLLPVRINDALMPSKDIVPEELSELPYINAALLRPGANFDQDVKTIIEVIDQLPLRNTSSPSIIPGSTLRDTDSLSENVLIELVRRFLTTYNRWYFNAIRIKKWGGDRATFEQLKDTQTRDIENALIYLENRDIVKRKPARKSGGYMYMIK